jgi:hypothetical protein
VDGGARVSPVVVGTWDGTTLRGWGEVGDPGPEPFVLAETFPTLGVHSGLDPAITLTPYTGPSAGGLLRIDSATTYENIDFGTTRLDPRALGIKVINCRFTNTRGDTGPVINCYNMARGGTRDQWFTMERCEIVNTHQWAINTRGVDGHDFILDRCEVKGFSDLLGVTLLAGQAGQNPNVEVIGCHLGELAFYAHPTGGIVHSSDTVCHADILQHFGGPGVRVEGNYIDCHYSETVGTGTPGSGSEFLTGPGYTQAAGEAVRFDVVENAGALSTGPRAKTGGVLAAIMLNTSRGTTPDMVIAGNWGEGGGTWLNASDAALTGTVGTIADNRLTDTMRFTSGGVGIAFYIRTALGATLTNNRWWSAGFGTEGATINRTNI